MQRFNCTFYLLGMLITGLVHNVNAATIPSSLVIPENGNVGDVIWESVPTRQSDVLVAPENYSARMKAYMIAPGRAVDPVTRNVIIAPGLALALRGSLWVYNFTVDYVNTWDGVAKGSYTKSPEIVRYTGGAASMINNTGVLLGIDNMDTRTDFHVLKGGPVAYYDDLRVALIRTAEHVPPGTYTIPAITFEGIYYPAYTSTTKYLRHTFMPASSVTVLGRTCSMSISNTHIDFGAMKRQSLNSDLSGNNHYSDVSASCINGTTADLEQTLRIKFSGGVSYDIPTDISGVVVKGSLNNQPCSAGSGWIPMNDTQWTALGTLEAGAVSPMANRRINWKVCQTSQTVNTGSFNASINYRLTIY